MFHRSTEPSLDFDFHKRRRAILLYHPNRLVDELGLADIKTLVRFNLKITVLHPSKSGEFFHKGWVGTCRCCKIVEPYDWQTVTRNIDRHTRLLRNSLSNYWCGMHRMCKNTSVNLTWQEMFDDQRREVLHLFRCSIHTHTPKSCNLKWFGFLQVVPDSDYRIIVYQEVPPRTVP